ncbi:NAD(P)-dependent oxidoreductase [Paramagnetospirillum kuznetsovii]|uniref:NAD(P)-dependent oxidoreductase n=1 Tax=Paramagnetospirillum kuznetsovii TaxID=2053833 RepID=A0A364P398_9PROT|nr:NAD(P)-dependent oxidoreductase [Paramagnetospirillum kuznetsovii]RAU23585.1 NAD(P)-dependent oxidoreductase [Paramagnetospirillum kuznetsovii]
MRIFLTGAAGFIGSHLLRDLLARGHQVATLLRSPDGSASISDLLPATTVIHGALGDWDAISPPVHAFRPDTVIHCAWDGVAGAARNDPRQLLNFDQATGLVALAAAAGAGAWIGLGSQAEYGPDHTARPKEDGPAQPATLYGAIKLSVCHSTSILARQAGMRFAWLRVFSTYGGGDSPHWMIPSLILGLLRGEKPALTPGEQLWDYLHVSDAAAAIRHVAETPECGGLYNLGSGRAVTLRQAVEAVRDQISPSLPLGFGEVPYRPDQVMHLEADISRLEAAGWHPTVDFQAGVAETVAWYRHRRHLFT